MTDMAASRKVMLDFITDLQLQKDKALAAAQAAQDRAEMMDKELKSQRSLVERLQVSVSESRSDGIRKYFPSNLIIGAGLLFAMSLLQSLMLSPTPPLATGPSFLGAGQRHTGNGR